MANPVQFQSTFNEQAQVSVRGGTSFACDKNVNQAFATAAITITLPLLAPDGHYVKILAVGGAVTVAAPAGQTIAGTTSHDTIAQHSAGGYTFDAPSLSWVADDLSS